MADPRPVSIKAMFDLPPEQAIAYLDSKGYRTSIDWTDTCNEEHDTAFTVAKVAKVDLLRTIHVSLLDAMTEGKPYAQWLAELQPQLEAAGWWGKVQDADLTGTNNPVTIGPRRLRTIYDTNLRSARSAALWERVQANKGALPFLRYSAVLDRRTRPAHRAWHGIVLPVDHPFWLTHFPPCGWNCRCTAIQLSEAMMARRGWTVTEAPPVDLVPFRRKGSGQVYQIPRGIDPGFGYNPGVARMQAIAEKTAASLIQAHAEQLPGVTADAALRDVLATIPADRPTGDTLDAISRLIVAGEADALAALLLELMGGGTIAAATLILDGLITAGSKRRRKRSSMKGSSYAHGGRPDQKREHGRFADEGRRAADKRASTQVWVADTIKPGAKDQGRQFVGIASDRAITRMRATGAMVSGRGVLLDHSNTIHIMRQHGTPRERLRGQEPIDAADLHNAPAIVDAAPRFSLTADRRGVHDGSGQLLSFDGAEFDGHGYGGLVELGRRGTVLRDLWKRKL